MPSGCSSSRWIRAGRRSRAPHSRSANRPTRPFLLSSYGSALHAVDVVLLAGHALDHPASLQVELGPFHVPGNRTVELAFERPLHGVGELMMREPTFAEHLENRLLHRLVLCPANVDTPLSLRVQREDFLFHGAKGEDEPYLDKSSCGFGGPALNNPFSGPSAIVAVESDADRLPSPRSDRNLLRPRTGRCRRRRLTGVRLPPCGAREAGNESRSVAIRRKNER